MPNSPVIKATRLESLVQSAQRRRVFILALKELALALAITFGASIPMLLLGTQILNWYWPVLLGAAGLLVGTYRVRTHMLSRYRVAQILDDRLALQDSISTAWFLLSEANREDPPARLQVEQANHLARSVDPARAFPLTGQRAWAITAALAVAALGLFSVRYLVTDSLSLSAPLISIPFLDVFERKDKPLSASNHNKAPNPFDLPRAAESGAVPQSSNKSENPQTQEADDGNSQNRSDADSLNQSKGSDGDSKAKALDKTDSKGEPKAGEASQKDAQPASSENQSQQADAKEGGSNEQNGGLVQKMKEALSSLMSKMKSNSKPGSPNSPDQDMKSIPGQPGDKQSSPKEGQDNQQQNGDQQQAQGQGNPSQQSGQTQEKGQMAQSSTPGKAPENSMDAQSGAGHQDGSKDTREAEQQKAMGKLAEIIGKRSANLTGEMTIETLSGNQHLKTDYSGQVGKHSDSGGEINRDQIPIADQQYVREYMEMVRKQSRTQE